VTDWLNEIVNTLSLWQET